MKEKDILSEVKQIKKAIQIKKHLVITYRTIAEGLQSPQYTDMPKSQNRTIDPMGNALHNALELETDIRKLEERMIKLKQSILTTIQKINNKEYQLLLLERYINEATWEEIGNMLGYSRTSIFNKHNYALVEFYMIMKSLDYSGLN